MGPWETTGRAGGAASQGKARRGLNQPALALQTAIETARMALAPSLDLDQPHSFFEPSSSCTIFSSIAFWSAGLRPTSAGPMIVLTLATALVTPAPRAARRARQRQGRPCARAGERAS